MAFSMLTLPFALGKGRERDGERTIEEQVAVDEEMDQLELDEQDARIMQRGLERSGSRTSVEDARRGPSQTRGPFRTKGQQVEGILPASSKESDSRGSTDSEKGSTKHPEKTPLPILNFDGKGSGRPQPRSRPRNVTITEPPSTLSRAATITEKEDALTEEPRQMGRIATLRYAMSSQWKNRHDKTHKGFWAAVLKFITGTKEDVDGPRPGDPDYVAPKFRWTPILSGLVVPFSILLEIPGLTEHWYVRVENNVAVEYQANPLILDVGLAISMGAALVANLALISRFLERRVYTATIVAIVGLTLHDLINIVAVTIFGVVHRFDDGFTYAEAFWLTVCSSVASLFTNCTLIYDLVRTKDFKKSGSGLTPKQRSLVIAVMVLLAYIALGALVYNLMIPEFTFQSSLYFTVVSIETIGFGDLAPTTTGSRIFFFFYETAGILNLAVAVGTARDTLLESWETAYKKRRQLLEVRRRERKKQRALDRARHRAIERRLLAEGLPLYIGGTTSGGGRGAVTNARPLNIAALTEEQLAEADREAETELADDNGETTAADHQAMTFLQRRKKTLEDAKQLQEDLNSQSITSEEGYREFTEKIAKEERNESLLKFSFAFGLFVIFWVVGATIFSYTEQWSWFEAFYFCYVSFVTVGFGDYFPKTPPGRAFFIVWAIFGVATMTLLIAVIAEAYETTYKNAVHKKGLKTALAGLRKSSGQEIQRSNTVNNERRLTRSATMSSMATNTPLGKSWTPSFTAVVTEEPVDRDMTASPALMDDTALTPEEELANLPYLLIETARKFHEHVQYFVQHHAAEPPPGLRRLLEAMTEDQRMTAEEKKEVLGDPDARRVLFMLSYERTMQSLVQVAEMAIREDIGHEGDAEEAEERERAMLETLEEQHEEDHDHLDIDREDVQMPSRKKWDPEGGE